MKSDPLHKNNITKERNQVLLRFLKPKAHACSRIRAALRLLMPRLPTLDVWTLENSINPWNLQFRDDKIENSYIWHLNKRYLKHNRIFSWFVLLSVALCLVYNWMVEPPTRFIFYVICNVIMLVPMVVSIIFTHLKSKDIYFAYRWMHLVIASCLAISAIAWVVGQPIVLLVLDDYLDLDPIPCLYMFMIFNLAVTNVRTSFIACSVVVSLQVFTCCIGLAIRRRPWSEFMAYLLNNFLMLVIAYLFALLGAYTREQFMRRIYLVKHFQQQEANVLRSSKLKLEILEEGIKFCERKNHIPPEPLGTFKSDLDIQSPKPVLIHSPRLTPTESIPITCPIPGKSNDNTQVGFKSHTPSSPLYQFILSHSSPFRKSQNTNVPQPPMESLPELPVSYTHDNPDDSESSSEDEATACPTPEDDSSLEIDYISAIDEDDDNENLLLNMLTELPHWLWTLPHKLQTADTRKGLRHSMGHFFKYRICMNFGDQSMEKSFQKYNNPMAINRIRLLMLFASLASISTFILNIIISSVDLFEILVRLIGIPAVGLGCYVWVSVPKFTRNPKLVQAFCGVACYALFLGNLLLTIQTHTDLKSAFALIDPDNEGPSLNMPTNSKIVWDNDYVEWMPKSPLNPSNFYEGSSNVWVPVAELPDEGDDAPVRLLPTSDPPIENYQPDPKQTVLYQTYLVYGIRYMSSLTGLILYMSFLPSSAGLRFVAFLSVTTCIFLTIWISTIIGWTIDGFDGQSVRLVLLGSIICAAGLFLSRVLEREMRRWYAMKISYRL